MAFKIFNSVYFQKFQPKLSQKNLYDRIEDIINNKAIGSTVNIQGWIKGIRKMKDTIFVDLNDGSCMDSLQTVIQKSKKPNDLSFGASASVTGNLVKNDRGQLEVKAEDFRLLGKCDVNDDYPFTPKQKHSQDYIRQYLHYRPRLEHFGALLRVRSCATRAFHDSFQSNNFYEVNTPILTSNDCEGAGEMFKVIPNSQNLLKCMKRKEEAESDIFFGKTAYLSVSGQLHLEAAVRALSKVYTFTPAFRAENSKSRLHLSEFYMIEGEEAFIESIEDVLYTVESILKATIDDILLKQEKNISTILKKNETNVEHLEIIQNSFQKRLSIMTYGEAFEILLKSKEQFSSKTDYQEGFTKEHELFLVQYCGGLPVFIVEWPKVIKPFYMRECSHDSNKVDAFDLLVPNVGELCGGSIREDNYSKLEHKLKENNLLESLDWYLQLRKHGNVTTAGFGLGYERFLQYILNINNIKDTIPFPRWPHCLYL